MLCSLRVLFSSKWQFSDNQYRKLEIVIGVETLSNVFCRVLAVHKTQATSGLSINFSFVCSKVRRGLVELRNETPKGCHRNTNETSSSVLYPVVRVSSSKSSLIIPASLVFSSSLLSQNSSSLDRSFPDPISFSFFSCRETVQGRLRQILSYEVFVTCKRHFRLPRL